MEFESRNPTLTIVLIGTNKSGKSSTGNSILGEKKFQVFVGTKMGTKTIQKEGKETSDTNILVVDTPSLEDTTDFNRYMRNLQEPKNGVFAIVIAIGRYTQLDKNLLREIESKYKYILKRSLVIFTRGGELSAFEDDKAIDKWLEDTPTLSGFINRHNLEFLVFENVHLDQTLKHAQAEYAIKLCKTIVYDPACIADDTQHRTITVEYDKIKKAFGEKGVEFCEDIFGSKSQIS